jgi:MerR family mercuric resistance operon transcriptional regulator
MTIGQLAKAAGVGVETIRYYQRRGILATPAKPLGGHRQYPESSLEHLAFIRRGQQMGFSLEEIIVLMTMRDGTRCAEGRAQAKKKLDELGERVAELNRMRKRLTEIVARCDANKRKTACPLIRALEGDA